MINYIILYYLRAYTYSKMQYLVFFNNSVFFSSVQKLKCFPTNAYMLKITYGSVLLQENDEIRCAAIHLMGNLSKFGSGEPVFKDQIHNVLVSLLLHLVDPNPQVVKVQKGNTYKC